MKKQLLVTSAYIRDVAGEELVKSVLSRFIAHFDVLLVTHSPMGKEIQSMVNYYVYDYRNEILDENPSVHLWADYPEFYFRLHKMNSKHHSFAVFRNLANAVNLIRDSYDDFIYIEGDCLMSEKDIEKLKEFPSICKRGGKDALFFLYPEFLSTLMFYSKINFFVDTFMSPKNIEEYKARSKVVGSFETLENFLFSSVRYTDSFNKVHSIEIENTADYFDTSTLSISAFSNGEVVLDCRYVLDVVRVENTIDKMCVCYLANGDNTFTEPVDMYLDDEKIATLPIGRSVLAIPINPANDTFCIKIGTRITRKYKKNTIFDTNNLSFIKFK